MNQEVEIARLERRIADLEGLSDETMIWVGAMLLALTTKDVITRADVLEQLHQAREFHVELVQNRRPGGVPREEDLADE